MKFLIFIFSNKKVKSVKAVKKNQFLEWFKSKNEVKLKAYKTNASKEETKYKIYKCKHCEFKLREEYHEDGELLKYYKN